MESSEGIGPGTTDLPSQPVPLPPLPAAFSNLTALDICAVWRSAPLEAARAAGLRSLALGHGMVYYLHIHKGEKGS